MEKEREKQMRTIAPRYVLGASKLRPLSNQAHGVPATPSQTQDLALQIICCQSMQELVKVYRTIIQKI